ncbi:histidine kinase [Corallococcus sp. H22C18031201]|uniref:sensor histidine kinase n=1 Tax=Citreicoccus inhibens TaxID=2849499 RepID=UPI000E725BF9|nr:sensor histidine kinase [Citreicoccus inhibens]MBU8900035.1 sensor histidine kinase [Citreicoccus inhibens]RJS20004.1 histidine kinase [Corallococcus sp. H22C18031201]
MSPASLPRSPESHTPHRPLPLTWAVAGIGLLFGVLMTYVPYEFRIVSFRPLYPYVRVLGLVYLTGSIALLGVLFYPRAPRWLDWGSRAALGAAMSLYWWVLNVRTHTFTGIILYPLAVVGLGLEAFPAFQRRPVFRGFAALTGAGFGVAMLAAPEHFPLTVYAHLAPVMPLAGALFALAGTGLLLPSGHVHPRLPRVLLAVLAVPFCLLAYTLGRGESWLGTGVYTVLMLACVAEAFEWRPRAPRTVGWKLLRGLAFAGLVPLLALGGLAAYLAQRAIEQQVRDDTQHAAAGEADFLKRYLDDARESLLLLLESPGFRAAFVTHERARLEPYLRNLPEQARAFDAALAVAADGRVLAASGTGAPDSTPPSLFPQLPTRGHLLSSPFFGRGGKPLVAVALPFQEGDQVRGLLVGLLSLERLSEATTPASRRFRVQVLDRRGFKVLRDTAPGAALLGEAHLPDALRGELTLNGGGVLEAFDASDRRILTAEAPVEGSDWNVVVTQELGVAYGAVTHMSAAVVGLVLLGVLLTLLLSQVVARDVIRRLSSLREATSALAAGDLQRRVEVGEDDELGELARSFNEMAARTGAAQEDLKAAVRAREEFLSVASHELRTPLTPLKGFAALTLQRLEKSGEFPERERLLKALRSMARQTERLARLVDDLLDTARIQGGRFDLERQPMDLVPLVREVLERFELRAENPLAFALTLPSEALEGEWDAPRLDQVLTNLLSNAVRYSPQGGTVRVSLEADATHVVMCVEDQGIGIPPESLAGLFRPFARASNATARHYGGLGLGLFICHEIVERHGGTIWAESPGPQQGSSFRVRLPRRPPPSSAKAA